VRREDFKSWCNGVPVEKCFAPLSAYDQYVKQVQKTLLKTKGIDVTQVVVTSDENDEKWWAEATLRGWKRIDHKAEGTAIKYSKWYEPILDVSTFSYPLRTVSQC
jgi:hypothetical protein